MKYFKHLPLNVTFNQFLPQPSPPNCIKCFFKIYRCAEYFFFFDKKSVTKQYKMKILSCVEYPVRKPACVSDLRPVSSEKFFNLVFKIEVNTLPRHDTREIAR